MAYANSLSHAAPSGLMAHIQAFFVDMKARRARSRVYRETLAELSRLSTRELEDLGMAKADIRRVAYEAAYDL